MLAQAEHDELAFPVLITTSKNVLANVEKELNKQLSNAAREVDQKNIKLQEAIKKINCPITLLQGEIGSTTQEPGIKLLKKQDPNGTFKIIDNSTHFLPMEYPEIVQKEIRKIKNRV